MCLYNFKNYLGKMADEGIETDEPFGTSMDGTQNGGDLNVSNQTDDLDDPVSSPIFNYFNF